MFSVTQYNGPINFVGRAVVEHVVNLLLADVDRQAVNN